MKTQKFIYIKRRIEVDDYLRNFIFFNINYRRKLWNLFVEEYYNCKENWNKFNPLLYNSVIIHSIDKDVKETSEYYASDIVLSVSNDINDAIKMVMIKTKNEHKHFRLRFKSYDRYKGSFKVRTCNEISKKTGILKGKVHIHNSNEFEFRAWKYNHFNITLRESLYDEKINDTYCIYDKDKNLKCYFHDEDIKQIIFIHELGKFYISLSVNVTYINDEEEIKNRKELAGIDLGIHNPITLYDGKNIFHIRMSDKELNKIHYLERRCKRLSYIMNRKMQINLQRHWKDPSYNIYTRSYERVRRKFRRTWKRIEDIRRNWRRKTAKIICNTYKTIVVDKFNQPKRNEQDSLSPKIMSYINHFSREHAMYLFTETLIHDCVKFGCEFIEAPKKTTRT